MGRKFARHYRRMLPTLLQTLQFCSDNRFQPLLEALTVIRRHLSSHSRHFPETETIPIECVVTPAWQEKVFEEVKGGTKVNRRYYELCVLQKLQRALKCKEVWVEGAFAFRNPKELLGFQFSPRLAELGETRFWRIDPKANYGALNGLARHRVKTVLIAQHWDDFLRVAGSLKVGTVRASELIRSLQRGGRASTLGRAIGELGRIPKTLHLLNLIADPNYRRHILNQLNRGEGRGRISRKVFHGQRGELRQRYREGQEDQLGSLA